MPEKIPNAENALIDPRKLRDYALHQEHATGKYKAAFFAQMGYARIAVKNMNQPYHLLDVVIANIDVTELQVLQGDLGTIVEIYDVPQTAYEVEFVNPDGSTRALLTLLPNQIRRLSEQDVLTTRSLAVAV